MPESKKTKMRRAKERHKGGTIITRASKILRHKPSKVNRRKK